MVAQGWQRSTFAGRSRARTAEAKARLRAVRELAFRGELAAARRSIGSTRHRRRDSSASARVTASANRRARSSEQRRVSGSAARSNADSGFGSDAADGARDEHAWLTAYVLCAEGAFERALAIAMPLARSTSKVRARAAVTAGSALRQLRRYDEARAVELAALRNAHARSDRAHLLIGLAADAVGTGDARTCARRLKEAERALPARDWRARVRLDWVRCEHALLTGNPRAAAGFARTALRRALRARALRHAAKSLLFLGVSLRAQGRDEEGREALRAAAKLARACGAAYLARVAKSADR